MAKGKNKKRNGLLFLLKENSLALKDIIQK